MSNNQTYKSNNTRLAKNTLFMYVRMGITMIVGLITSRIVLQSLGAEDFGLYNVVSGVVVLVTFLNSSLSLSAQRFMSYAYGEGKEQKVQDILNASFAIFLGLCVTIIFISETIGVWFINEKMVFPAEKVNLANWVFQFSMVITCTNILRTPFNALFISSERFDFYAKSAIVESVIHLAFVLLLLFDKVNPSYIYIVYQLITALIMLTWYYIYFRRNFKSSITITKVQDKTLYKDLFSFSGWTILGTTGVMGYQQGINILLNLFFGISINAAYGIANRVNSMVNQFFTGFQQAANPQITKAHANGDTEEQTRLIIFTSKISFFLLLTIGAITIYNIDFILNLWLGDVPTHTTSLCCLMIIGAMIDSLSAPLYVTIYATGKIKVYQIVISCLLLTNILFSYIVFRAGMQVEICMVIRIFIFIISYIARLIFVKKLTKVKISNIISDVVLRVISISFIMFSVTLLLCNISNPLIRLFAITPILLVIMIISIYYLGFNQHDRKELKVKLGNIWESKKRQKND